MPFMGTVSLPVMKVAGLEWAATNVATVSSFEEGHKSDKYKRGTYSSAQLN